MEAWVLESELALLSGDAFTEKPADDELRALLDQGQAPLVAEVLALVAAHARLRGDLESAEKALDAAEPHARSGSVVAGRVARERAELLLVAQGAPEAAAALEKAIGHFAVAGDKLQIGRAMMRMASLKAMGASGPTPPAAWLARASDAFGSELTWRDRVDLRAAFRLHGRRLPDQVLAEEFCERIDGIDRVAGEVGAMLQQGADQLQRRSTGGSAANGSALVGLLPRASSQLEQLHVLSSEIWDLATSTAAERDRFRMLLVTLIKTSSARSLAELCTAAVSAVVDLAGADCVMLVKVMESGYEVMAAVPEDARPPDDVWRAAVDVCMATRPSAPPDAAASVLRSQQSRLGPVLAVPVRATTFKGALYVDKLHHSGHFDETSHKVITLLGMVLGHNLEMFLLRDAEQEATAESEATFEAIRDGVLSVDENGTVKTLNQAAARMLLQRQLAGRRLQDVPELAPLAEVLVPPRRLDGSVVSLKHGQVVVTARPVTAARAGHQGVVATLVELERARRAALRFVNARPPFTFDDVVGSSSELREAVALARRAASLDANVLITGESGTGKEILAQSIHTGGSRGDEPFVGINCAALPRELLESELFGYERGSFTGARIEGAAGKFELAADGTLLLDEIGDMPLDMQAKLLRVVEARVVTRLGSTRERPVRARIISTTHRDLDEGVERGSFRLDLLFRLRVLHVHLPPLRERADDIEPLALHFLRRTASLQNKRAKALSPYLLQEFLEHDWPGNVRELANVMEREVGLLDASEEVLATLRTPLYAGARRTSQADAAPPSLRLGRQPRVEPPPVRPMAEVEKETFLAALDAFDGHVASAARALEVSQASFYAKLKAWKVERRK